MTDDSGVTKNDGGDGSAAYHFYKDRYGISKREWEVASLLVRGLSYREIAASLGISFNTVSSHVKSLLQKTRVRSSRQLAVLIGASLSQADEVRRAELRRLREELPSEPTSGE